MRILVDPALLISQPISVSIETVATLGFDGIELGNRPDLIPAYGELAANLDQLTRLGKQAEAGGAPIESVAIIQSWASPDEAIRRQAVAWWKDGIRAAVALGAPRINTELTGDPKRTAASRDAWVRSLEELAPIIEAEGVEVHLEPHPGDFIETTAGVLELIDATGVAWLGYLHCLPHSFYLDGTVTEQLELARGRVDHIHLADTFRPTRTILNPPSADHRVHQHFDIGAGEVPWDEVTTQLAAIGFDGTATVQVYFWDERAQASYAHNLTAAKQVLGLG